MLNDYTERGAAAPFFISFGIHFKGKCVYLVAMKQKERKTILAIRITPETKVSITRLARITNRTPSEVVRKIIEDFMQA